MYGFYGITAHNCCIEDNKGIHIDLILVLVNRIWQFKTLQSAICHKKYDQKMLLIASRIKGITENRKRKWNPFNPLYTI